MRIGGSATGYPVEYLIDGAYSLAGPPAGVLSMAGCCAAFTPPAVCLRVTVVSVSRLTLRDPCYIAGTLAQQWRKLRQWTTCWQDY